MSWHRLDHNSANQYFFQPESFLDDMGSCWNNQLLFYDLQNECWQEVNHGGHKPSQRAAAASVYVPEINQVALRFATPIQLIFVRFSFSAEDMTRLG